MKRLKGRHPYSIHLGAQTAQVSLSKPSSQKKPLPHTSLCVLLLSTPSILGHLSPHTCLLLCLFLVTLEGCLQALPSKAWVVFRRTTSKTLFIWSTPVNNDLTLYLERPQISSSNPPQAHPGKLEWLLHIDLNLLTVFPYFQKGSLLSSSLKYICMTFWV